MNNHSSVTIDAKTAESIFTEIGLIEKRLAVLRKKVMQYLLPASYGSDAWWEKEIKEGLEEVKKGKYTVYETAEDLVADLHAGK